MSERTRQEVWEQIMASELVESDVVPLPIKTAKLLLECARLVNEGAATKLAFSSKRRPWVPEENILSDEELRYRCQQLSRKL